MKDVLHCRRKCTCTYNYPFLIIVTVNDMLAFSDLTLGSEASALFEAFRVRRFSFAVNNN